MATVGSHTGDARRGVLKKGTGLQAVWEPVRAVSAFVSLRGGSAEAAGSVGQCKFGAAVQPVSVWIPRARLPGFERGLCLDLLCGLGQVA